MHKKAIFLTFLIIFSSKVLASQDAMVVKNRALVYADKMLTSPIGYLNTGRKIKVGSTPRNNGRVLPVLLKGKVGYIEIKNLSFDTDSKVAKNRMRAFEKERSPQLYVNYSYNISGLGDQWSQLSTAQNEGQVGSLIGHRFDLEIHPPASKAFGTIGLGYSSLTQDQIAMTSYIFTGNIYYSVMKFRHFTLDLLAGIELSPQTSIQIRGIDDKITGSTYGWQYGLQVRMMYNLRYGLVAGYYIKKANAEKLINIPKRNSSETYSLTSFSGNNVYLGLSYRFK